MESKFSVNRKLELMQQIRSRYRRDKTDLFHREKLLYGRTSPSTPEYDYPGSRYSDAIYDEEDGLHFSTFPLRLFLAVAAFTLIVLSDKTGSHVLGLSAEECFQAIAADYESSIAAWTDAASNTITNKNKNNEGYDDQPLKDNPPAGVRP